MSLELLAQIVVFIFSCGVVYGRIKSFDGELKSFRKETQASITDLKTQFKEDIGRLEKKQEKYNNLQERTLRSEVRLDNYDRELKEIKEFQR